MTSLEKVHALIVEDDYVSIEVLRRMLNQLSVNTTVIYSGEDLIDNIFAAPRPDVVDHPDNPPRCG